MGSDGASSHPASGGHRLARFARGIRRPGGGDRAARSCDGLTGLLDRGSLAVEFPILVRRACHEHTHVAVLVCDIDRFRQVNCEYGRSRGDSVLVAFSARVCETLRDTENAFRWGGEQFVVAAYGHDADEARALAERLCATVAARPIAGVSLTVSVGVALGHDLRDEADALVEAATAALRQAKRGGRGRVVVADALPGAAPAATVAVPRGGRLAPSPSPAPSR
ncbi:MAG: GGDEF domain-containing protein [Solirubrobacteraceae bacterium]|nr:GGDEF domain-containing protein [Patulibacter sp.]